MSNFLSSIPRFQRDTIRKDWGQLMQWDTRDYLQTKDDSAVLTNIQEILDQDICCVL